ncbi:uncharacterized protein LOC131670418 [Phymastichus coffea]|uniref:uncharacterized protein LOC131670418 n=1 Tax=Phymastichus coffea TaxID=108790 RepID=UPI00273BAD2E|nr:uncharacterized protein LOC131670418 [Phymastichus coffea]
MSCSGLLPLSLLLLLYFANAEWIEIPQYSDQHKVYRMPTSRPHHRVTQLNGTRRHHVADDHRHGHWAGFHQEENVRNISKFSRNRHSIHSNAKPSLFDGTISSFTTDRTISSIDTGIEYINSDEGIVVESSEDIEPQFEEIPVLYSSSEDVTATFNANTNFPVIVASSTDPPKPSKPPPTRDETENDQGFFDYLPIDLLKRVHKTLKLQPPTLKGKIRFLKAFERTLVQEIENRLSKALAPRRTTRGARGHDDHDESLGFPSLEGALMAISFLTFAVYLVRLVMLLFRNVGNGAPPIIIGRKKRSIDEYTEQAARIFSYLDASSAQYYKSQKKFSRLKKHV